MYTYLIKIANNLALIVFRCSKIVVNSSTVQTQITLLSRITLNTNLMHGPAIYADPEVAFRKLPNIEFFMFYFITSKSG